MNTTKNYRTAKGRVSPLRAAASNAKTSLLGYLYHRRFSRLHRHGAPRPKPQCDIVVSLTSFPARIDHVWKTIESLFAQSLSPAKIVLNLAVNQFPNCRLPASLVRQEPRGLTINWVAEDQKSYKKLLPARLTHPAARIITVDDDVYYKPWLVRTLVKAADENPCAAVGCTGREAFLLSSSSVAPYLQWPAAHRGSPPCTTILTGVGGILYPRTCHKIEDVCNFDLANTLCPNADDIWFWAHSRLQGTPIICLGTVPFVSYPRPSIWPELSVPNRMRGENDLQLSRVLKHYGNLLLQQNDGDQCVGNMSSLGKNS